MVTPLYVIFRLVTILMGKVSQGWRARFFSRSPGVPRPLSGSAGLPTSLPWTFSLHLTKTSLLFHLFNVVACVETITHDSRAKWNAPPVSHVCVCVCFFSPLSFFFFLKRISRNIGNFLSVLVSVAQVRFFCASNVFRTATTTDQAGHGQQQQGNYIFSSSPLKHFHDNSRQFCFFFSFSPLNCHYLKRKREKQKLSTKL